MKQNNSYIKGVVLFSILLLPSILYLAITTGKHNFMYLPTIVKKDGEFIVDKQGKMIKDHQYVLGDFSFHKLDGSPFSNADMNGQINLVTFMKDNCEVECQTSHYKLKTEVLDHLSKYPDLQIITFVIPSGPQLDFDEENHRAKSEIPGVDRWHFVTAPAAEISRFAKENLLVGAVGERMLKNGEPKEDLAVIVDKNGQLRTGMDNDDAYLFAYSMRSQYEINFMLDDLKLLMAEYQKESKKKE